MCRAMMMVVGDDGKANLRGEGMSRRGCAQPDTPLNISRHHNIYTRSCKDCLFRTRHIISQVNLSNSNTTFY